MAGHRSKGGSSHRRWLTAIVLVAALTMLFATSADAFVFWANRDLESIGRAKTNGKGVDQSYIKVRTSVYGVAVDDDHVYWTDRKGGGIGRASRDGSAVKRKLVTGLSSPHGIAVDDALHVLGQLGDGLDRPRGARRERCKSQLHPGRQRRRGCRGGWSLRVLDQLRGDRPREPRWHRPQYELRLDAGLWRRRRQRPPLLGVLPVQPDPRRRESREAQRERDREEVRRRLAGSSRRTSPSTTRTCGGSSRPESAAPPSRART